MHKRWADPAPLPPPPQHPTAEVSPAELRHILTPAAGQTPRRYISTPTTTRQQLAYPVGHTLTLLLHGKPAATATICATRPYTLHTRVYICAPLALTHPTRR